MMCTGVCAIGMYLNAFTILSGWFMQFASIIAMAYMMYKVTNVYDSDNTRIGYLWALAFFMGFLVGPLIHQLAEFEPEILVQAISYTTIIFASFTGIALFTKQRSMLFLGGIISSLMSCMFWYRMITWMFGSKYGMDTQSMGYMMVALFVACLYIVYDTQMIIARAETGDRDVPKHTMILFVDLFDLFIRILQVLIKLNEDRDSDKKKKRRN